MNSNIIRFAATTALAVTAFSAFAPFATSAHAGGEDLNHWRANYGAGASAADNGVKGDFDSDGEVDGRDFLVWQRGSSPAIGGGDLSDWQSNYGVGAAAGDIDHDGDVDANDYILWRKNLPPAASNKLFVGGLSWDTSNATAQFNPREIAVEESVPWQQ